MRGEMKRWLLCTLVAPLSACGPAGGSSNQASNNSCSLGGNVVPLVDDSQQMLSPMSASHFDTSADPFETYGKVLIQNQSGPSDDESGAIFPQATGEKEIAAGTELSITLRDSCRSGALSSRFAEEQETTPSGLRSYTWTLESALSQENLNEMSASDDCVVGVSDSVRSSVSGTFSDPLYNSQAHLKAVQAEQSYGLIYQHASPFPTVIAIIDTGVDLTHPDLRNVLWRNAREIPGNNRDDDGNGYRDDVNGYNFATNQPSPHYSRSTSMYQHGTHVAGLAAAQAGNGVGGMGVAGLNTRIMALNVFGPGSGASSSDIANAIRYAADNHADVINLSLGGSGRSAVYESALVYALRKGVTIIAAAGNERRELGPNYFMSPAGYAQSYAGMIAIGSIDTRNSTLSSFSNFSSKYVELAAPGAENSRQGVGVLSTWPGGGYQRIQGTSMASPVAAGGAALAITMMRSRGYAPSPATVEGVVTSSATSIANLRAKIKNGRSMNLKALAEFINKTYPQRDGRSAIDPGVPGAEACAPGSSL